MRIIMEIVFIRTFSSFAPSNSIFFFSFMYIFTFIECIIRKWRKEYLDRNLRCLAFFNFENGVVVSLVGVVFTVNLTGNIRQAFFLSLGIRLFIRVSIINNFDGIHFFSRVYYYAEASTVEERSFSPQIHCLCRIFR